MFATRWILLVAMVVAVSAGLAAGPSRGAGPATRHVVKPGDTLWEIAAARYAGDPRAAVWRIQERNGLVGPSIRPGMVLYLPP
jgi:nucleoid-associated protein YgaU